MLRYFLEKEQKKFSIGISDPAESEYSGDCSTWRSQGSLDMFTSLATEFSAHKEERHKRGNQNGAKENLEEFEEQNVLKADHLRWTKDNLCR